jgi:hypothetical protein
MSILSKSGIATPIRKSRVVPDENKLAIRDLFGIDPKYLLSDSNIYTKTLEDTPVEERTGILPLITEREGGTRTGIDSLEPTFTRDGLDDDYQGPQTNFNINPAAFLTGKGRIDPMGSDMDYFLNLPADRRFGFGFKDSNIPGSDNYVAPSKYFEEPSFFQKGLAAIGRAFQPKVQGTLGDRLQRQYEFAKNIPSPLGILASGRSPFNPDSPTYNKNLPAQLNALEAMGPGFIGRDPGTGGLKYGPKSVLAGKNVISGFGTNNPEVALKNYIEKMKKNKKVTQSHKDKKIKMAEEELKNITGGGDGGSSGGNGGGKKDSGGESKFGGFCFDPNTLVQMADGSEKKIKEIQLGDQTKGGEVTGVFQFKASDEIHDYKGVTVAGSHYVKENGRFIMVQDSPISVKIDKIPVVYSLDTTGRRIFIKDIEFADYNGDGIAKGFLANAGVDLNGFDKEVLRQVENRLI